MDWNIDSTIQLSFAATLRQFSSGFSQSDWNSLHRVDKAASIKGRPVDFAINEEQRPGSLISNLALRMFGAGLVLVASADLVKKPLLAILPQLRSIPLSRLQWRVGQLALFMIIGLPIARYIASRLAMIGIYPAQSKIVRTGLEAVHLIASRLAAMGSISSVQREILNNAIEVTSDLMPKMIPEKPTIGDILIRHVVLENKGIKYHGVLYSLPNTLLNKQWVCYSLGNAMVADRCILGIGRFYSSAGFNTLVMDGPGVGRSEGHAVPETMGDAVEVGLQYLEKELHAQRIALVGFSLGGAMLGQAIKSHTFQDSTGYKVAQENTFSRTSDFAALFFGKTFGKWIVGQLGLEMDSVEASQQLSSKGIQEYVIGHSISSEDYSNLLDNGEPGWENDPTGDGVIPGPVALGKVLKRERITDNKVFKGKVNANHLPEFIDWDQDPAFFSELSKWTSEPRSEET